MILAFILAGRGIDSGLFDKNIENTCSVRDLYGDEYKEFKGAELRIEMTIIFIRSIQNLLWIHSRLFL